MADNAICVCGTLGKDPELRFSSSGNASVNLSIAVRRSWKNKSTDAWEESTSWFYAQVWGTLAESAAESLHKGDRVVVTGRLEQRSYEKDGEKRSVVEIVADDIGASLKYATAVVSRTERTTDQRPAPARAAQATPAAEPFDDESPF